MLVTDYMAPNNIKKDIALEIIFILLIPILVGRYLDNLLNTNFITVIFILLAVVSAFYRILKIASFKK